VAIFRLGMHALIAGCAVILADESGAQQDYPNRAVRIVVPYSPGGSVDFLARLISPKLTEMLGRQLIIDNRAGGNTIIGTEFVARAAPDGYTLLLGASGQITIPHLYRKIQYDAINDFAPIAGLARSEFLLLAHRSLPVNTVRELIALAKTRPGELNYATSSTGGPTHLSAVQFEMAAKIRMQQIPYKGGGPAMADLLGGQVQLIFSNPASSMAYVTAGRVKALAVTGNKRLEMLPNVPTFAQSGVPGVTTINWYALYAPAGTPNPIVDSLAKSMEKIMAMADIKAALVKQGLDTFNASPAELDRIRRADYLTLGQLIKAANITLQD
jgi:tripartite-type tricarboxylate transporter receptor subunit TctC